MKEVNEQWRSAWATPRAAWDSAWPAWRDADKYTKRLR